jgi:diguanylate cyclase (GGDEF)-like protein
VLSNTVKEDINKILSGHFTHFETRAIFERLENGLPYSSALDNARVKTMKCWFYSANTDTDFKQFNDLLADASHATKKADSFKLNLDLQTCQASQLFQHDKLDSAIAILKAVIKEAQNKQDVLYQQASANLTLGRIYRAQGLYQQAFSASHEAYILFEQGGFDYDKALMLRQIGLIHADLYNFSLAIKQLQRAIEALAYYNEQEWYKATDSLAQAYEAKGNKQKALALYNDMLALVTEYEGDEGVAYLLLKIAELNTQLGQLKTAKQFLDKVDMLKLESEWITSIHTITTAEWLLQSGQIDEAEKRYNDFKMQAPQSGSVNAFKRFLEFKRALALHLNNYQQEALAQRELLIIAEKKTQEIADNTLFSQRLEFDWEQQDQQIAQLKAADKIKEQLLSLANSREFWQTSSLIFALVLVLILGLLVYKQSIHKQQFKTLALKDELTGIANRRAILAFKRNAIEQRTQSNKPCALIAIDIDYFKLVNDTYGHDVGDHVINSIVELTMANIRKSDCVGRVGGEEFLIVLPDTSLILANEIAERIRASIDLATHTVHRIKATVSIGVIEIKNNEDPKDAAKRVDSNLYAAKNAGRNSVVVN